MKKLLAILLILSMLLCALPALAEGFDDALDAAFEAGRVKFTQANYPLPDLAACEIVAPPDELWQFAGIEPMNEAQMRAVLTQAELAVFSYAPWRSSGPGRIGVFRIPMALWTRYIIASISVRIWARVPSAWARRARSGRTAAVTAVS